MAKKYPHRPHSEEWEKSADKVARVYAPDIYPCQKCGAPVIYGYCCTYCGDSNPSQRDGETG